MSLLGKKPFVQDILGKLSVSELSTLASLSNASDGNEPKEYFLNGDKSVLSESDKGVRYARIKIGDYFHVGYLCYASDGTCGFFAFQDGNSEVTEYSIDVGNHSYKVMQEHLSAAELRSEIDDRMEEKGGEAVISANALHNVLEGSEFVTADLNEAGNKVKVDIDTDYRPYVVELNGETGMLSEDDFVKLCGPTSSYTAIILLNEEFYHPSDETDTFDVYTHAGKDNQQQTFVKSIYIYKDESMANYRHWTLVSNQAITVNGDTVEIPENLTVDKDAKFDFDVEVDGDVKLNGALYLESEAHIVDHGGYPLIKDAGYPGYDLTERFSDEIANYDDAWAWIKARIAAANFTGLNIKDYIPLTLNNWTFKMQIAGIDTYYKNGSPEINHHIDFISKELWPTTVQWNLVNNNNGTASNPIPFMASNVKKFLMSEAGDVPNSTNDNTTMTQVDYTSGGIWSYFPSSLKSLIVEKNVFNVNRYNEGSLRTSENTNWGYNNLSKLWLPDEMEVYGHTVYETNANAYGNFWRQYPLFEDGSARVKGAYGEAELGRETWWLVSPYSGFTTYACRCDRAGLSGNGITSISIRVPVCFRIA